MRRDELRTLPWRCVDLERGVFVLEDSKVGARAVPISAPVRQILAGLPRVAGNDYVFCGRGAGAPLTNTAKPWARVLAAAEIAPTRLHDLRHTAASTGISAGASLALIGGVLGHRSQQTTARYAHLADDPVRATSEAIAERIAQALGGGQAEVVTLHPNQPRNVSGQR
jgi:integrase